MPGAINSAFSLDARQHPELLSFKEMVMIPWEESCPTTSARRMIVPIAGEGAWLRPEGRKPYFRGAITSLTYEFSR